MISLLQSWLIGEFLVELGVSLKEELSSDNVNLSLKLFYIIKYIDIIFMEKKSNLRIKTTLEQYDQHRGKNYLSVSKC